MVILTYVNSLRRKSRPGEKHEEQTRDHFWIAAHCLKTYYLQQKDTLQHHESVT